MALVTKSFSDIITFTRTGTNATYFNSAGVLTSAGADVPRFDYNPATLAAQGLLIEEARQNLLPRSEEFSDASWTKSGSTVTADSTTAPSGTATADTLTEDTSTGQHRVFRSVSGTTNTNPYTYSIFAKAGTRTRIYIGIVEGTTFVRQGNAVFDLSAGTIVSASTGGGGATGGSATIQNVGNGWYRCTYTVTLGGTDTTIFCDNDIVSTGTTITYTGNGTGSLFIWGAQLEAGAFPTSYIPTTTTALTRSADVASVNTLSPWYNAAAGTVVAVGSSANFANFPFFNHIHDGTNNNQIATMYRSTGAGRLEGAVGGVAWTPVNTANTVSAGTTNKLAFAWTASDQAVTLNAGTVATGTNANIPTVTTMHIGGSRTQGDMLNGYIQRITYYPRRLSNAELQAITA